MSINCDIILQWGATPAQLTALGGALWHWCHRRAEDTGSYRFLDNQALADLVAGKLPLPRQPPWRSDQQGVHFWLRDETSADRKATIASLRLEIPTRGVEDILVDGRSWNLIN